MGRMSSERIFRKPKRKPPADAVEKGFDDIFDNWSRKQWADVYLRTGNVTSDQWAQSVFKPYHAALDDLTGGRFQRVLFEGIIMESCERFWPWDRILFMAQDRLDKGDTSHDWPGLIELILSYHRPADSSPKRDIQ